MSHLGFVSSTYIVTRFCRHGGDYVNFFRDVTSLSPERTYQYFGRIHCVNIQGRRFGRLRPVNDYQSTWCRTPDDGNLHRLFKTKGILPTIFMISSQQYVFSSPVKCSGEKNMQANGQVDSYQVQIPVKHNYVLHKIFLWQHVSTLLNHQQAFQRTDPMYLKRLRVFFSTTLNTECTINWICSLEDLMMIQQSRNMLP